MDMMCSSFRLISAFHMCIRLFDEKDSWLQAVHRLWVALCMCTRLVMVYLSHGPDAALGWVENAHRIDRRNVGGYYHVIRGKYPIVPESTRKSMLQMFDQATEKIHPFNTGQGQSICYTQHWPDHLKGQVDNLYLKVLGMINEELPTLHLHPIKESFSERMYAISYPGAFCACSAIGTARQHIC